MTMITLEQARQHLHTLGLRQAGEALDNTLDAAASKQLTYPEMLADLSGFEVAPAGNATSPPRSGWPTCPSTAPWSSSTSPSTRHRRAAEPAPVKTEVKELANLAFVTEAADILLLGSPCARKAEMDPVSWTGSRWN